MQVGWWSVGRLLRAEQGRSNEAGSEVSTQMTTKLSTQMITTQSTESLWASKAQQQVSGSEVIFIADLADLIFGGRDALV